MTKAQAQALDKLSYDHFSKPMGVHANTLYALERMGLVEIDHIRAHGTPLARRTKQ